MCWSICMKRCDPTLSLKLYSAETSDGGPVAETETPFTLLQDTVPSN